MTKHEAAEFTIKSAAMVAANDAADCAARLERLAELLAAATAA